MNKLTIIRAGVRASNSLVRFATTIKARTLAVYVSALYDKLDTAWALYQDKRAAVEHAELAVITAEFEADNASVAFDVLGRAVEQELDNLSEDV
jgi:hypothetical protein